MKTPSLIVNVETTGTPTLARWEERLDLLGKPSSHLAIVGLIHEQRHVAGVL
jgi:hypothetical protein